MTMTTLYHEYVRGDKMDSPLNGQIHDRTALILYGSETGKSEDVAEDLGRMVERLHFATRVKEMDTTEISELLKYTIVIIAISTTGQGEFPKNARKFWKSLLRKRLPVGCLSHVSFTTFGLGDSSYPKFNVTARKLHKRLEQLGAKEVYPRGEGDEQHDEGIDGGFLSWAFDLRKNLLLSYPFPEGVEPIPADVLLPPKFELEIIEEEEAVRRNPSNRISTSNQGMVGNLEHSEQATLKQSPSSSESTTTELDTPAESSRSMLPFPFSSTALSAAPLPCPQVKEAHPDAESPIDFELADSRDFVVEDGIVMRLIENRRVTPESHWQDVRELTFETAKAHTYLPGDTITIFPKNFPQDVQALIDLQGWNDVADKPLRFKAGPPDFYSATNLLDMPTGLKIRRGSTLRDVLTSNLDITAIPKRSFFHFIALQTQDDMHRQRLLEFQNPAFTDEFYDYTARPRRSILEVLQDFPSVKIPFKWVCTIFPVIRGRKYSICSGGELQSKCDGRRPDAGYMFVQILVAIVKYRTVLKNIRQGLCSRYLASLPEGKVIVAGLDNDPAFTREALRDSPERPVIFIAPGTGLAPCRSLIWERAQRRISLGKRMGPCYLFYGGRNANADYFYEEEWKQRSLQVTVFTAFSRDQKEKIYVQDIIRRERKLIASLFRDSTRPLIYVCGSSGNMPKAVRAAFVDAATGDDEGASRETVERELEWMESDGTYIQETW